MRRLSLFSAILLGALILAAGASRAQWSTQSIYTEDGVELGVDGRVFSLFALFNALGFDEDTKQGPPPLRKPLHAEAREKARAGMGRAGPSWQALEAVIAKHPLERSAYVAAVLELGPAPNFDDSAAKSPLAKALARPLRDWFNEEGGVQVMRAVATAAKPTQKKLLPALDQAARATFTLVRLGDAEDQLLDDTGAQGRVAVVLNELDAHGTVQRVDRGDVTHVVVGPMASAADEQQMLHAAVAAIARTLVAGEVEKLKPGSLADASKLGGKAGKVLTSDKAYATELLACAFMRQVRGADAPCVGSPVEGDPAAAEALAVLAPRVDAFAKDTVVLTAAIDALLAPGDAAATASSPNDKKKPAAAKTKAAKAGAASEKGT